MIRFRIENKDAEPVLTEWLDETLDNAVTAREQVAKLRTEHPFGAISVERSSVIPRKKQTVVRFKIQEKDDLYYSRVFPISEQDTQLEKIKAAHPDAEITPEVRDV